jgi:uncharacterized protein
MTARFGNRALRAGMLVAAILFLWTPSPIGANEVEDCGNQALLNSDPARALAACQKLAREGSVLGQYTLGAMYARGQGVARDDAEAANWYRRAAEQGFAYAQYNLGFMYDVGQGIPQDSAEALNWYRLAADQGNAAAQNNLGTMYQSGQGMPPDYTQALMWFNLAAARGIEKAIRNRDNLVAVMASADVSKAQRLVREWLAKHQQD